VFTQRLPRRHGLLRGEGFTRTCAEEDAITEHELDDPENAVGADVGHLDCCGAAWRRRDRGPLWAQTHLRLSSKEGTVPIDVAITLAQMGGNLARPTSRPRMMRLVMVEMAETEPYLIRRRSAAPRKGKANPDTKRSIHTGTVDPVGRPSRPAETRPHELGGLGRNRAVRSAYSGESIMPVTKSRSM
jgi:hypothetical protein